MQVQPAQLRERNGKHPRVQGDRDGGVAPYDGVQVEAGSLVLVVPLGPVEIDRVALERANQHENEAVDSVEGRRGPQGLSDRGRRKDAQEEEDERHLGDRQLDEVQELHDVEPHAETGDAVERNGPDILTQAVGYRALRDDDRAGNADGDAQHDPPVVAGDAEAGP